ncbi:MAG: hypothetical protein KAR13_17585 [Desulfobulbaceae bacterium]|nr:hypothetical protein [Desulfobulbaceae bacterium]
MNAHDLELDYFKLYDIEPKPWVEYHVDLQGQFDEEPERTDVTRLRLFANPVSKNREAIYDRNAHLAVYQLAVHPWFLDPKRKIVAESQFGKHSFDIGHDFALLAPAKKYERGLRFPEALDHYKVYSVEPEHRDSLDADVTLQDQFSEVEAKIQNLVAFAVPAEKKHAEEKYEVRNEKAHLMIFWCETPHVGRLKRVADQFDRYRLYFGRGLYLGVPCLKHEWHERRA